MAETDAMFTFGLNLDLFLYLFRVDLGWINRMGIVNNRRVNEKNY
jgi:hypothetical protein